MTAAWDIGQLEEMLDAAGATAAPLPEHTTSADLETVSLAELPDPLAVDVAAYLAEPAVMRTRSERHYALVGAAIQAGYTDEVIYALALRHAPTREKFGDRTIIQTRASITKLRVSAIPPEAPLPLTVEPVLPPFPVEALPEWLADYVNALAEATQTSAAMVAPFCLAVIAATVGGRVEIEPRPGWRELLVIFVVIAAQPGERKSAVASATTGPLLEAEESLAAHAASVITEARVQKDIAEDAAAKAKAKAAKAEDDDRHTLTGEAISAAMAAEAIVVPTVPRIVADDVTPEAAATLLADQGGRLAILSAEGGIFDVIAGRYSGNVPNMDVWLKGIAGDLIKIDRRSRPPEYIRRPALTVGLMCQPSVLDAIARIKVFRGRGLLARFLYVLPDSKVGNRRIAPTPVPEDTSVGYRENIRLLATTYASWQDPAILTLTDEAAAVLYDHEAATEARLRSDADLGHMTDWGSKMAGATVRLAGLLHAAEHLGDAWRQPVSAATMRSAITVAGFFADHAVVAFGRMGADPAMADARTLLDVIVKLDVDDISRREMMVAAPRSRFGKVDDPDAPIAILVDHGYLVPLPAPTVTGPGRKPSPRYKVVR